MDDQGTDEPSGSAPLLVSLAVVVIVAVTVMVLGRDAVEQRPEGLAAIVSETTSPVPVPLAPVRDPAPFGSSTGAATPAPAPVPAAAAGPAPVARVATPVLRTVPGAGAPGLPLRVELDASGSTGRGLTYRWDLDGDGTLDDASWPRPAITFDSAGRVPITLVVTDRAGRQDRAALVVRPGRDRPTSPCPATLRACRTAQR